MNEKFHKVFFALLIGLFFQSGCIFSQVKDSKVGATLDELSGSWELSSTSSQGDLGIKSDHFFGKGDRIEFYKAASGYLSTIGFSNRVEERTCSISDLLLIWARYDSNNRIIKALLFGSRGDPLLGKLSYFKSEIEITFEFKKGFINYRFRKAKTKKGMTPPFTK